VYFSLTISVADVNGRISGVSHEPDAALVASGRGVDSNHSGGILFINGEVYNPK
jgi:hypothetical protein